MAARLFSRALVLISVSWVHGMEKPVSMFSMTGAPEPGSGEESSGCPIVSEEYGEIDR
jgi:hypothetical protein